MRYTPEKLEWHREYYHSKKHDPEFKEKRKWAAIEYKYGLTKEDYYKILDEQNGCCKICLRAAEEFSKGLYVDHCHATERVRGLLCVTCNNWLGGINDNPEAAIRAKDYLTYEI